MSGIVGPVHEVDVVTVDADGRCRLIMTQVAAWNESPAQLLDVQVKVNNYLSFALDEQLARD